MKKVLKFLVAVAGICAGVVGGLVLYSKYKEKQAEIDDFDDDDFDDDEDDYDDDFSDDDDLDEDTTQETEKVDTGKEPKAED